MAGPSSNRRSSIGGWARQLLPCITPQLQGPGTGTGTGTNTSGTSFRSASQLSPWINLDPDSSSDNQFAPGTELINSYQREQGQVRAMAAGNGGFLYTGSDSKNIRVWKEGNADAGFKTFSGPIYAIVSDPHGRVFSSHEDGKIRVWQRNAATRRTPYFQLATLPMMQDRFNSAFYRVASDRFRGLLRHDMLVSCLCLSEDGRFLYSGAWDRTIKTWRLDSWWLVDTMVAHTDRVNAVAAGFDGLVFAGSANGSIKMWRRVVYGEGGNRARHMLVRLVLAQESSVNALVVGTDTGTNMSLLYAGLSDGTLRCWQEGRGWDEAEKLQWHRGAVTCVAVSSGPLVFSGSVDAAICIWRREQGGGAHSILLMLTGHAGPVNCLAAHDDWEEDDDGARQWILYSGGQDRTLKVWRVVDPQGRDEDQLH